MTTAPDPIRAGVAVSGVLILVHAATLARALLRPQGRSHDDLAWPIILPACGLLLSLMGLAYSLIPLTP